MAKLTCDKLKISKDRYNNYGLFITHKWLTLFNTINCYYVYNVIIN